MALGNPSPVDEREDTPNKNIDTERRDAFLRSIRAQLPVIAGLYEAGRQMVESPGFPARGTILAHAVREIRRRLPDAYVPKDDFLSYPTHLERVREQWDPVRVALGTAEPMAASILVPAQAAREITDLLDLDAEIPGKVKARFLQMCALVSGESVDWAGLVVLADQWNKIRVEQIAHSGTHADDEATAIGAFLEQENIIFKVFEYAGLRERRILALAQAATTTSLEANLRELVTVHDKDVFFTNLADQACFALLDKLGEFVVNHNHYFWPQGPYVLRCAKTIPQDVAALLRRLPPTTPGVTRQMFDIAMALPDDGFIRVMERSKWLRVDASAFFLDPLLKAMERLARLGAIKPLFSRARRLLDVTGESIGWSWETAGRQTAKPVLDRGDFEDILEKASATLYGADPMRTLEFLRMLLDRVIDIEGYDYEHHGFWYTNLLESSEPHYDVKTQVTGVLVNVALQLAATKVADVAGCFDGLATNATLYRRLADAVVATHGSPDDAAARIADADRWTYGAECRALLERGFVQLAPEVREGLVARLFTRQRAVVKRHLAEYGRESEDAEAFVAQSVSDILGTAIRFAPEPYHALLAAVAVENSTPLVHAVPDLPAFEELGIEKIGAALEPWVPPAASNLPGANSIGGHLRYYVEHHGADWLAHPLLFETLPAYFLGWALNGLDGHLRNTPAFQTAAVDVANAALVRAHELHRSGNALDKSSASHIAQNAGSLLLEQTKKAATNEAVDLLLTSAALLKTLPRGDHAELLSPWSAPSAGLADPETLAIHVVGQLILVVHNAALETAKVRDAFDDLSTTSDWRQRAALGRFYRWAIVKFPADAERWTQTVFLTDDEDANRAAWAGYIAWSQPSQQTHDLLRAAYRARLNDITLLGSGPPEKNDALKTLREKTLWHVWVFFANDIEKLDDESSLAHQMVTTISDRDLGSALRAIGASLRKESDADHARAMELWDFVAAQVEAKKRGPEVCCGIAQWIAAPLPADWRFAKAATLSSDDLSVRHDAWVIVKAAVALRDASLIGALKIVERLLQSARGEVLTAVQQFGQELLIDGAAGGPDERHLAQRIDSYLVTSHRPSLLTDSLAS